MSGCSARISPAVGRAGDTDKSETVWRRAKKITWGLGVSWSVTDPRTGALTKQTSVAEWLNYCLMGKRNQLEGAFGSQRHCCQRCAGREGGGEVLGVSPQGGRSPAAPIRSQSRSCSVALSFSLSKHATFPRFSPAQAAGCQPLLCSMLPAPSPASTDLRSAAVLARKEEIELVSPGGHTRGLGLAEEMGTPPRFKIHGE